MHKNRKRSLTGSPVRPGMLASSPSITEEEKSRTME
jgi:hypothetical protein